MADSNATKSQLANRIRKSSRQFQQIYNESTPLHKDDDVETLVRQSRDDSMDEDRKKRFATWVRNAYTELYQIPQAKIIMKIVACTPNVEIIFTPGDSKLTPEYCGMTIPDERKIFIAAGGFDYQNEKIPNSLINTDNSGNIIRNEILKVRKNELIEEEPMEEDEEYSSCMKLNHRDTKVNLSSDYIKGLIIHEFCHFAVYVTFCNNGNAFFFDDEIHKNNWDLVQNECYQLKDQENLIKEAFLAYSEDKILSELVVRWFQYNIEFRERKEHLETFKQTFPKLKNICEGYVFQNFKEEYKKLRAIFEINEAVNWREKKSPYNFKASNDNIDITSTDSLNVFQSNNTLNVIKSNCPTLAANKKFHSSPESCRLEKYIFLNSDSLIDKSFYEKLQMAMLRKVETVFMIIYNSAEGYNQFTDSVKKQLKDQLSRTKSKMLILLDEKQNCTANQAINFTSADLTVDFVKGIEICFQGKNMLLKELVSLENFKLFKVPLTEEMFESRISIGNHMKLQVTEAYVERKFLIEARNEKWEKLDNIDCIFEKYPNVLVTNEPGAGKSIESVKMYYRFKNKYPDHWVVHTNLSNLVEVFEAEKKNITYSQSDQFKMLFCRKFLQLSDFEAKLFEEMMKTGRVILIFDSLDEISPYYIEFVKNLLSMIIRQHSNQRMMIFTRPHLVENMRDYFNLEFIEIKIAEMDEDCKKKFIAKLLQYESEQDRIEMQTEVELFLKKYAFYTPLLIRMVTKVASLSMLNLDKSSLYSIYDVFSYDFYTRQKEKNKLTEKETYESHNIEKFFQQHAIEKLLENRVEYDDRIKVRNEDFNFFGTFNVANLEILQRKGITVHEDSEPCNYNFIHASFYDFYIAKFIRIKIETLFNEDNFKSHLMEIFFILQRVNRLNYVINFLKCSAEVKEYLKEFGVLSQMISEKKIDNGVNIMPVIKFISDKMVCNKIMKRICIKHKLYSSQVLFKDPIKTIDEFCSITSKSFVYENILMDKPDIPDVMTNYQKNNEFQTYYKSLNRKNILDILAQCGKETPFGFYVSKEVFDVYFDKLTLNIFKLGQIAYMIIGDLKNKDDNFMYRSLGTFNRSFFLMARNQNKTVINTFFNFYEKLLENDSYFADPRFSSFISILILNNESDPKLLMNNKFVRELFSASKFKLKIEWGNAIHWNIKYFRDITSSQQFEIAINFYMDIFDNGLDDSYSQQVLFWYKLILTLQEEQLYDMLKITVERLIDKYENSNALLRDVLMKKDKEDDEGVTILEKDFCPSATEKDQLPGFTFKYYKRVFGYDALEICNLFLEPKFYIKLLLAQNDNSRIISSILQYLNKAENKTNSWLDMMISYSNYFEINLMDSLLNKKVLRYLSFKDKHSKLPKLIKQILQKCIKSQNYLKVVCELLSNEFLTKDELADIFDAPIFKDDMLESQIKQILSYKDPENGSTIIIAASKCKQEGRVEILMKMLEIYSDPESFKNCLLSTDNESKSALYHILRNQHQENYFLTFLYKFESYHANDRKETDRLRDLIYAKAKEEDNCKNIFFETLISNEGDISEEKHEVLEQLFKVLSRDEQKRLMLEADYFNHSLLNMLIKQSFEMSKRVLSLTLETLFENENLHQKVLQKLKHFTVSRQKLFMNVEIFSSAFNYYKLESRSEVVNTLHCFLKQSKTTYSHNLSIGNFQYFRQDHVIWQILSKIKNDEYSDENLKNLMITFIFMLNCDDYVELLKNVRKEIQNYMQSKKRTLFCLIKSIKLNIEELEVFFEKNENVFFHPKTYNKYKPFCLYLTENSYRFLHEFLDFIESMCVNETEFRNFLALQLYQLKYSLGNNIFHYILSNSEKYSDSTMYFDVYETFKNKLGNSDVLIDLNRQTNDDGETPIMLALKYTDIKKCLKFLTENFVETSMRDLLQVNDSLNDISHIIFINLTHSNETLHSYFESIIEPLKNYFDESEINGMFENACTKNYPGNQNFIHVLFGHDPKMKSETVSVKYLSFLFDEMKKKFGIDHLTELMLEEDKFNRTPLQVIHYDESFMPFLKLIEKHFDRTRTTIKILLSKNEGTYEWILYKALKKKSAEDRLFTVQLYKKYFPKEDFENILKTVFETSDEHGNTLINNKDDIYWYLRPISSRLNFYFEIISDNIHDNECIKIIISQLDKNGRALLAIDNFRTLNDYVNVVKLTEFYFSRDLVENIFKVKDSSQLQRMFFDVDAKDYERNEMLELLKEYHPDEWTRILVNNQVQSIKIDKGFSYRKITIIEIEFDEYGYAFHDLLRILKNKLSNFERSIEQENHFQGYAIVINEYSNVHLNVCLQAVFSIPREKLPIAKINGLRIEWEYDAEKNKLTKMKCTNEHQKYSLGITLQTCIAIKSNDERIKVLVPVGNFDNSLENSTKALLDESDDISDESSLDNMELDLPCKKIKFE